MATAKKLPSGSYRVNLYIGKDADGKRQYKSFTAPTKKQAEYLAAQYNQMRVDINRSEQTLHDATERYIKSKENILSPSTIRVYYFILKNNIPELMSTKVRDITAERVQYAFNDFAKEHSPKTCRNVHGLISAVLKTERPEIALNTTLPQKKKRDIYVPDSEEVLKISDAVSGLPVEMPFLLATQCGLRASEISALMLSSVFEDHIEIKQARVDSMDGTAIKAPKSAAGYRKIPISPELYRYITENAVENGRVCNMTSREISSCWSDFRDKHGLNPALNFHALRHHFASRCLLLGMPQKYTAELMGHSSLDMIEKVYQHTFPSAMKVFADKLRQSGSEYMQHKMQHKN